MPESCACVVVDDYDSPGVYEKNVRKARKAHVCVECRREIAAGDTYEHVRGSWDGRFSTFKTCLDCLSIRDSFFCAGYLHGNIKEALQEHLDYIGGQVASSCLETLTPAARAKVIDAIDELWEDDD